MLGLGLSLSLGANAVSASPPPVTPSALLLETSDVLLTEDGSRLLLE